MTFDSISLEISIFPEGKIFNFQKNRDRIAKPLEEEEERKKKKREGEASPESRSADWNSNAKLF